jgi:hypothetical protein
VNGDELRALMRSDALSPAPDPDTSWLVRDRAREVRRRRARRAGGAAVVLAVVGLVAFTGVTNRLVEPDRRSPGASAADRAPVEPPASAALVVSYSPGAYDSVRTEQAVADCAAPTTALVRLQLPQNSHLVVASGSVAEIAGLRACLAAVPGATVTDAG